MATNVLSIVPLVTGRPDPAAERMALFEKGERSSMGLPSGQAQYVDQRPAGRADRDARRCSRRSLELLEAPAE